MKAEIKFIAEDYQDTQDLRKIANYSGAYLALYRIRELVGKKYEGTGNELYTNLITDIDGITSSLSIDLDNDVR